jgi:fido (protein-threonine AMPylation protein)
MSPSPRRWQPITDLSSDDLAAASDELPALAAVWSEERDHLGDDQSLAQFNERLAREWAIETGVIERVYTLDTGTTEVLIEHGIDAALIPYDATDQPPELVVAIIKDQRATVDWLFDFVADRRVLTTSFVKELHALMTRHQRTATGVDQFGNAVEVELRHGEYKAWPNNPTRPDGTVHEYCPPVHVDAEMEELVKLHGQHLAEGVPPEVAAAWLHHRFTQIHPFQDGNGRIARALASLVFLHAGWFPLVITRNDRPHYIDCLERADTGDLAPLVGLFATRQKKAFVAALGIAREVVRENERVDQVLASIGDMFSQRDAALAEEQQRAKGLSAATQQVAIERFEQVASDLGRRLGSDPERRAFVDLAPPPDDRRYWHRAQVLEATRSFGYFAGFSDYSAWVRLGIATESGRGEVVVSFHSIGRQYRGVIGAVMVFFRRSETEEGSRQTTDVTVLGNQPFQVNYKEDESSVLTRFRSWLEQGLVEGLDTWRRTE